MTQQTDIALGVGARSEKGRRDDNQDKMTAFSTPLGTFYIVADGMGGHHGGAEASRSVVEGYRKHLLAFPEATDFADILQHATALTNAEILAAGRSGDPTTAGMGSTVVMAMLRSEPTGMEMLTAHIGDSRAYLLRGGLLTQLTHDHSTVQRMVDENLISAAVARTHPDLNVLTRALGKQNEVAIEVGSRLPLYPGDTVLLCTDGLWGHVSDEQIVYELGIDRSASETADVLVELALDNGSDDNITLQILRLEDRQAGRPFVASDASGVIPSEVEPRRTTQSTSVTPAPPPMSYPETTRLVPKKKSSLLYALLIAACVFLAAGGMYFTKRFQKTVTPPKPTQADPKCFPRGGLVSICVDGKLPDSGPGSTDRQRQSVPQGPSARGSKNSNQNAGTQNQDVRQPAKHEGSSPQSP